MRLRSALLSAGETLSCTVHKAGTYVCMEGPQFSTRAESHMHRAWGGDLIGMTVLGEEGVVGGALGEELADQGERDGEVCAGAEREV